MNNIVPHLAIAVVVVADRFRYLPPQAAVPQLAAGIPAAVVLIASAARRVATLFTTVFADLLQAMTRFLVTMVILVLVAAALVLHH
jgi:hypothetical protein